jgi:hypothetical protein
MCLLNRRIHVLPLALAAGITWSIAAGGLALWATYTGHGKLMLNFIADCYPFYAATLTGCLWGLLWGFVDMFCGLFIFGLLYNLFSCEPKCPESPPAK